MAKKIVWALALTVAAALLQSTVLSRFVVYIHAAPDLTLGILVYAAYMNGTMAGQLTGFFSGMILDFLSSSPLGLNAFIRTLTGAITGLLKDNFYLDYFFFPMILCAGATIFKAVFFFMLHLLFPESVPAYSLTALTFWIELGLNVLTAPLLFGLLRLFGPLLAKTEESRQ
jgi:rod shape-determining protein MreD